MNWRQTWRWSLGRINIFNKNFQHCKSHCELIFFYKPIANGWLEGKQMLAFVILTSNRARDFRWCHRDFTNSLPAGHSSIYRLLLRYRWGPQPGVLVQNQTWSVRTWIFMKTWCFLICSRQDFVHRNRIWITIDHHNKLDKLGKGIWKLFLNKASF